MATPKEAVIQMFLRKVEKDCDFFEYFNLTQEESEHLAQQRAMGLLDDAVSLVTMECKPSIDLTEEDENGSFSADLNASEKILLSCIMYELYLEKDIAYLKLQNVNYTSTDLRVFDPSNWRYSFNEMYQSVKADCSHLMDVYRNTDRDTGALKALDFSTYDSEG